MDSNNNGKYDDGVDEYSYRNTACRHGFSVTGETSVKPEANAFVVEERWVGGWPWDGGHFEKVSTPVYNFDNVHVATMDSIRTHERPNHS